MNGPPAGSLAGLETVHAVEPHAGRVGTVGIKIGERRGDAAGIPFLAVDRAGVTADADVEVDDEAKPFRPLLCRQAGHVPPPARAMRKRPP